MPAAKRYWVKVNVPSTFLTKLPYFAPPISKTRAKKISIEEKKSALNSANTSKVSSPTPGDVNGQNQQNSKINSGLKESSTSGLTMNSINNDLYALDRTGKPSKRWVKRSAQFKNFTGFKIKYVRWKQKEIREPREPKEPKEGKESKSRSKAAIAEQRKLSNAGQNSANQEIKTES
ncbi:uncharacterized protein PRCAT00003792001 [Priceomyces carsonii]|uniref:uncharacterized protein n=1 Tax=Priceomyces carsonii TaxID=28549 RepID=UPI002ED8367D|nr:unnamed protein product [Priceomyces carsonii]